MLDNNAHTWSEDRTKEEISLLLPKGWVFRFDRNEIGYWETSFLDETNTSKWSALSLAPNIALFNAYGWIALQRVPRGQGVWGPRRDLTLQGVNAEALRKVSVPDPEDLDPVEIASVYDDLEGT